MSWVYLIVGVVCLIALQSLRTVLSIEFPIYKSSRTPRPDPYKFGGLDLHKRVVSDLGVPRAKPDSEEGLLHFAGEHMNSIRTRLLDRGRIVESDGTARPSVAFAIKLLRSLRAKPKPAAADSSPIPTPRLAFFSNLVSQTKERAPSQQMQWLLLSLSSVLFVAIGWPLLGLEFTLVILGVIAFHETGHWVAMRMFGYRNPHITLLPLLGGVTIGHETEPSAAKRAWVALAGPLPGIVLAWVLVYFAPTNLAEAGEPSWFWWVSRWVYTLPIFSSFGLLR